MKFIKNVYFDDSLDGIKLNKIITDLECGEFPNKYYVVLFRDNENYLEILSDKGLKREVERKREAIIVGIAKNNISAKQLLVTITEEMFNIHKRIDKNDLLEGII